MTTRRTPVTGSDGTAPPVRVLLHSAEPVTPDRWQRGDGAGNNQPSRRQAFGQLSLRRRVFFSQLPLTLSVLLVLGYILAVPKSGSLGPFATPAATPSLFAGVAGVMVLTVAAAVVPWDRLPRAAYWAIPLLDFVAIAAIWESARFALDGMSMLSAFPVVWLAWTGMYPVWAIILGFVGSAAATWWPYVVAGGQSGPEDLLRPILVPVFMLTLGVAANALARSMDRQRDELQEILAVAHQQNRRLETILDTTDVGIVVTDVSGQVVIRNSTQQRIRMLGVPPGEDDVPEHQLLVFEPDGTTRIPAHERPIDRAIRGESYSNRLMALGANGSQQIVSVSAQVMKDRAGRMEGTVVVFKNVTDLVDAIQSREQFVADVSHEFRTPLTSIIGFLDLAIEDAQDPQIARYLGTCQRNADRLLSLVNSLLESASSKSALAPEHTDLARIVRHSVESAQVRAANAEISLVTEMPAELSVRADRLKMSQVADNLISNAIKYTEAGGTVTVRVRQVGDCAEVEVADNGIGMSAEEQDKLFSNFYRTEHVRRAAIPGTGLGLAITRAYVRAHGGDITVTSQEGVGSVFTASIPLLGPATEAEASEEETVFAPS